MEKIKVKQFGPVIQEMFFKLKSLQTKHNRPQTKTDYKTPPLETLCSGELKLDCLMLHYLNAGANSRLIIFEKDVKKCTCKSILTDIIDKNKWALMQENLDARKLVFGGLRIKKGTDLPAKSGQPLCYSHKI